MNKLSLIYEPQLGRIISFFFCSAMETFLQSFLIISVLNEINKWIYSAIKKNHNNSVLNICAIKIKIITAVVHQVYYLILRPTNDETKSYNE